MEDSEQRKKRLKEMRLQADQAEASRDIEASTTPGSLSSPLMEASPSMPNATPRFYFYTDPMSAFSLNKRSNANFQDAPYYFPCPYFGGSPMAQFSSPHPESTNSQMTPSPHQVLPVPYRNPGLAHYNFPSHPSSGGSFRSPRLEPSTRPLMNSIRGLTHRPSYCPSPTSGYKNNPSPRRGRGYWNNSRSPGSWRGGGRGLGSHSQHSYGRRSCDVNSFYKQSMVEDPWNFLKPDLWKGMDAYPDTSSRTETSNSWKPKSLSTNWKVLVRFLSSPVLNQALLSSWLLRSMKLLLMQMMYYGFWHSHETLSRCH